MVQSAIVIFALCLSYYCHTSHTVTGGSGLMWIPTQDEAVLMYARFLKARHGTAASKFARNTANTLQNEGELKAICFGMLSQMPWTDLPVGLSPGCSTGIEPLN